MNGQAPAGADSASRTARTIAAQEGVRSPRMTLAPSRVVSKNSARSSAGSLPSGSGGTVRDRIAYRGARGSDEERNRDTPKLVLQRQEMVMLEARSAAYQAV